MVALLSSVEHKARKEHVCVWCGELINKGEHYIAECVEMDGDLQNQKWHKECLEASNAHFRETHEDTFDPYSFKRGTVEEKC